MNEHPGVDCMRRLAPAKLNLFLEVLARRADGYHDIETLMVAVSVFDTVEFAARVDDELRVDCNVCPGRGTWARAGDSGDSADRVPDGADNLVYRAAERLRQLAGIERGATIRITKRIPVAAGLGGASSDAAATLVAANRVWKIHWPIQQLLEVAGEIGSDVPFFITGGAAVCRGRGERVQAIGRRGRLHFVIVRPPKGLRTADVYRCCEPAESARAVAPLAAAIRVGAPVEVARHMFNRLQFAAARLTPWLERLHDEFERVDCLGHQMSGSGTSYFGVCRHARHARRVAARLRARAIGAVHVASTLAATVPVFVGARES